MAVKKQLSSHQFEEIYKPLGIVVNDLGCIMLDVDGKRIKNLFYDDELYVSPDKKKFWIKGFVSEKTPHITLLYGLLKSGTVYKKYVDKVLDGWWVNSLTIKEVSYFDSSMEDEPYYCIVAKIETTPELLEGHERLQFLPHIDTFTGYTPHVTIAYIKKNKSLLRRSLMQYNKLLRGKTLKVVGINYGGNKQV